MATKKTATKTEDRFENQDFNLFDALEQVDRKNYSYFSTLTGDQQKKFSPFMMLQWVPSVTPRDGRIATYYLMSVNQTANAYFFDSRIQHHPELQWLMLCASSPGLGKQFRKWVPKLSDKIAQYKIAAKDKDYFEYYSKLYPSVAKEEMEQIAAAASAEQNKRTKLAAIFPNMKLCDIEALSKVITDEQIKEYESQLGE